MEQNFKKESILKLKKFVTSSSQKLIGSFLDEPYLDPEKLVILQQKVVDAKLQKSLTVIQTYEPKSTAKAKPISGYIMSVNENAGTFIFRDQKTNGLTMFSIKQLHKISLLTPLIAKAK